MPITTLSLGLGKLEVDGRDVGWLKGEVSYQFQYDVSEHLIGQPRYVAVRGVIRPRATLRAAMAEMTRDNVGLLFPGGATPKKLTTYTVVYETFDTTSSGLSRVKVSFPSATLTAVSMRMNETTWTLSDVTIEAIGESMPVVSVTAPPP